MCILPAMSSIHTADSPMPGLSAARTVRFWSDWFNTEVADFWLAHLPARWRFNRLLARVCERRPAAAGAVTLRLRVPRRWTPAVAGQHVDVTVEIDGVRHTRSYSLSAPPSDARHIEITVAKVAGGKVSGYLCSRLQAGDVVQISPPYGGLRLPEGTHAPLLLLAAGSGITPLRALLLDALERGWRGTITLGYWAQTRQSLCFAEQWQALQAQHDLLRVNTFLTRDPSAPAARINAESLAQLAPDLAERTVLACGPAGFVDLARTLSAGAAAFHAEGFTPPTSPASEHRTVRVELRRQGLRLDLPTDQPLLAALESAGQRPAHGCRQGICNTCACHRISGASRDLQRDALASEPSTSIRLCVHAAADDLVLDL